MSGYRTHLIFYVTVTAALFYVLHASGLHRGLGVEELMGAAVGALYSLLPDVDAPSSKIGAALSRILLAGVLALLTVNILYGVSETVYLSAAAISVLLLLRLTGHRGATHTPLAGAILSAPLVLINPYFGAMAFLGYATHLLLDGRLLG